MLINGEKKRINKIFSIVICCVIIISMIQITIKQDVKASKISVDSRIQVGDNIYATLDDRARLIISGSGDMWPNMHMDEEDYAGNLKAWLDGSNLCPWFGEWQDEINEVVIGEGVANVGKNAFKICGSVEKNAPGNNYEGIVRFHANPTGLQEMTMAQISSTVKSIDEGAFFGTSNLKYIDIPANVKEIKKYAFYKSGLSEVKLHDGIENIGEYAFSKTKLTSINIPGTVKKIEGTMLEGTKLKSITINNGTSLIKPNALGEVKAIIYSNDVTIMEDALDKKSEIVCYKNSTADKYAREHNIKVTYLSDSANKEVDADGDKTENDSKTEADNVNNTDEEADIYSEFVNSKNNNWKSVCFDGSLEKCQYVKYGKISIAMVHNNIYVKKGEHIKKMITLQNKKCRFGTTLTNGTDIIYQSGRGIYLWKNIDKKIRIATLKNEKYYLDAIYGEEMYLKKYLLLDTFEEYKENLKTGVITRLKFDRVMYSNGKYIVYMCLSGDVLNQRLKIYDAQSKKNIIISKKVCSTTPGIHGEYLYYTEFTDRVKYSRRIVSYNLKTHKKKYLKTIKNMDTQIYVNIDKNRVIASNNKGVIKIYNIKNLK